jgi:hypothetical protein
MKISCDNELAEDCVQWQDLILVMLNIWVLIPTSYRFTVEICYGLFYGFCLYLIVKLASCYY